MGHHPQDVPVLCQDHRAQHRGQHAAQLAHHGSGSPSLATIVLWVFGKQLGINANTVPCSLSPYSPLRGVVTAKDLKEIDWAVIWMVAGGFALGLAMNGTGVAEAAVKSIPFAEFNPHGHHDCIRTGMLSS